MDDRKIRMPWESEPVELPELNLADMVALVILVVIATALSLILLAGYWVPR